MKKLFSIACLALVVAALASCKKTYVTEVTNVLNQTWVRPTTIKTADWTITRDGKADSVDIAVPREYEFFNNDDATLVYFSFFQGSGVYEQVPEVFNGTAYSYFHYTSNDKILHLVLYAQPVNGGTPVKPVDPITLKLILIASAQRQ